MILAVVGSRSFLDYAKLSEVVSGYNPTKIVSGGAQGADRLAERYAKEHNIPMEVIYPDWLGAGKSAGVLRNMQIVDAAEFVLVFWNGMSKGSEFTVDYATKIKKSLRVVSV